MDKRWGRLGLIVLVVIGVVLTKGDFVISQGMDAVYDDNLVISKVEDRYGINKSSTSFDSNYYQAYFKISGCYTIWEYDSEEDCNLDLSYTFDLANEKAKLVHVTSDGHVTTIVEGKHSENPNQRGSLTLPIKKGLNRLKIIGHKKSAIDLTLQVDKGAFKN